MQLFRHLRGVFGSLAVVLVAVGCTSSDPVSESPSTSPSASGPASPGTTPRPVAEARDCGDLAARTVDALQAYVDEVADLQPEQLGTAVAEQQATLDEVAAAMRDRADTLGCSQLRSRLADELERLDGDTPVAQSVAGTIRSSLLGTDDPSDPGATDVAVDDADELLTAAAQAGTGSVITLSAGTYSLDRTLVLFRSVTLQGPEDGEARITSTAEGAAVLAVADGPLRLRDLTVAHRGQSPASLVVVRSGGHDLAGVELTGARRNQEGAGGFGLAVQPAALDADTEALVTDSTFRDNEGGGILVGGDVEADVEGVVVEGPGGCGICFHEEAGGRVEASSVRDHDVGIRIEGGAAPTVTQTTIRDNAVGIGAVGSGAFSSVDNTVTGNQTGIEIAGSSDPSLRGDRLVDNTDTGLRVGGTSAVRVTDVAVEGETEIAVVVVDDATPTLDGGTLRTTGEAGIVSTGDSAGSFLDLTIGGQRIGLQVEQRAAPELDGVTFEEQGEVAVIATGSSAPRLGEVTCADGETGAVLLLEDTDPEIGDEVDCEVVDERGT